MKNAKNTFFGMAFMTAVLLFTFISCNKTKSEEEDKTKISPPSQIVTVEKAKLMYDTYGKRRVPLIQRYEDGIDGFERDEDSKFKQESTDENTSIQQLEQNRKKPFDVTRYVSYEYDTIKKYIAYIEKEAERAGVKISTLRFYLSNYPEKDIFPKDTAARSRQNSVFITPTIKKDKRDYPYYGEEGNDGSLKMILLNDSLTKSKTQLVNNLNNGDEKSLASFLPTITSSEAPPVPIFFANKSYALNKGTGAPPPYPQN
ncbi:hypothetical protein [Maribacter sp. 2307UL18-2]|uniref:hypothetical protein n=1 Tax=Maribacter sp. 2307UL18-2 TaxID=3386274 RepID=UPI0039BC2BEC